MLPQGSVYNVLNIVHDLEKGCRLHKKKKNWSFNTFIHILDLSITFTNCITNAKNVGDEYSNFSHVLC